MFSRTEQIFAYVPVERLQIKKKRLVLQTTSMNPCATVFVCDMILLVELKGIK